MALIPEDGTGLVDSNSYVSLVEADIYFSTHPFYADTWSALGDPDKETFLIAGAGWLDAMVTWKGYITYPTQAMDWPRTGVYDDEGRAIPSNVVPEQVKKASMEVALFLSKGDPLAPSSSAGLDKLKIDVIELDFTSSTVITTIPASALLMLKGLGSYTYGGQVRKVLVG